MPTKLTIRDRGPKLTQGRLHEIEHFLCPEAPGHLPVDYRKFLLRYNGGTPDPPPSSEPPPTSTPPPERCLLGVLCG